ncbi:hypothetical protein Esi_0266_0029 [Ectocarpus siliculosus]|uniref:Uncharacterized protein n=1 Tax=Ectocarpus siliculosus TaxID=2880 RepID=D7FU64_ECTSI|nr:hypothetical protein Esi_0266_0029 [Ectocarpus siliculosus]|eukprot:CBJ31591.1 hypothetical protein Esi_0266_0029 [Ectocarpus siliculosus]
MEEDSSCDGAEGEECDSATPGSPAPAWMGESTAATAPGPPTNATGVPTKGTPGVATRRESGLQRRESGLESALSEDERGGTVAAPAAAGGGGSAGGGRGESAVALLASVVAMLREQPGPFSPNPARRGVSFRCGEACGGYGSPGQESWFCFPKVRMSYTSSLPTGAPPSALTQS